MNPRTRSFVSRLLVASILSTATVGQTLAARRSQSQLPTTNAFENDLSQAERSIASTRIHPHPSAAVSNDCSAVFAMCERIWKKFVG